jgi:dTDP-4-amino-4,6-dideoxygalactose transaminase
MGIWNAYCDAFADLEARELVRRPVVPDGCEHNAHLFYLLLPDRRQRDEFIAALGRQGVQAVFHYVPLHSSPAGRELGRTPGSMSVTDELSGRLVRLPVWHGLTEQEVGRVVESVHTALAAPARRALDVA